MYLLSEKRFAGATHCHRPETFYQILDSLVSRLRKTISPRAVRNRFNQVV